MKTLNKIINMENQKKYHVIESAPDTLWKISLPAEIMKLAGIRNGDEVSIIVNGGGTITISASSQD